MLAFRTALLLGVLLGHTQAAIFFYIDGPTPKCFFEELYKDTLVVGNYKATHWDERTGEYYANPAMGVQITVDETFDSDHRIYNQAGSAEGSYTFSAADSGEHRLCFTPTGVTNTYASMLSGRGRGDVKFELDMTIGDTSAIESSDKDQMGEVVQKVRDLNAKLHDIKREQIYQREREAEFRDQSEKVNARVVRWALIQLAVLGVTCAWQLSYLRAFFIKQKLT